MAITKGQKKRKDDQPFTACCSSSHDVFLHLLLEGFAGQDGGQHSNEIFEDIGDHPGLEEASGHVLRTRLALMFTLADPLLLRRNLQIELCEVMATIAQNDIKKKG